MNQRSGQFSKIIERQIDRRKDTYLVQKKNRASELNFFMFPTLPSSWGLIWDHWWLSRSHRWCCPGLPWARAGPWHFFVLLIDCSSMGRDGIMILRTVRLEFLLFFLHYFKLTKVANYYLKPTTGITQGLIFLKNSNTWSLLLFHCYCYLQILILFLSCRKLLISVLDEIYAWVLVKKHDL